MQQRRMLGFTLIELLIVVLIIAILAAIAVPNFLEFQVRAKVSRVMSDLRTVASGLEAYAVDNDDYPPNDGYYNVLPVEITTPIAYITNSELVDPFTAQELHPIYGELARFYTYTKVVSWDEMLDLALGGKLPPVEGVDAAGFNEGALERYGPWRLVSNGPDRTYSFPGTVVGPFNPNPIVLWGADIPYDPTNGTVSLGNILRTQTSSEGILIAD
jgi:prepilin-type N-terminal cleavage/methylation domain-containing protein